MSNLTANLTAETPKSTARPFPVRGCRSFEEGQVLHDPDNPNAPCPLVFRDSEGREQPTWWRPFKWWPDGSVMRSLFGCQAEFSGGSLGKAFTLETGVGLPANTGPKNLSKRVRQLASGWSATALAVTLPNEETYLADLTLAANPLKWPETTDVWSMSELEATVQNGALVAPLGKPDAGNPAHAGGASCVHTYHAGHDVVELVITWHSGIADEKAGPKATIDHLRFLEANLLLPLGWRVKSLTPMPGALQAEDVLEAGRTKIALIPRIHEDGELRAHLKPQQAVKVWRLVACREGNELAADDFAEMAGWGMFYATDGEPRPNGCGTYALGIEPPDMRHVANECAMAERAEYSKVFGALSSGQPMDHRYLGPVGPHRPWGVAYGGMTGGDGTTPLAGVRALGGRLRESFLLSAAVLEMTLDLSLIHI